MKITKRQIRRIVEKSCGRGRVREMDDAAPGIGTSYEDVRELAKYHALNGDKDQMLYRDNPDYREAFDQMTMRESRKKRRNFILESRAESLLGLPRNPSPQDVYQAVLNYFSGISNPSKDPNVDLIDRVIANVMVKNQIRKDDEHIGSKLNMLRRILDPDKARVDSYRRSIESEMRELDPTGKKQKYEYQTPSSLRMRESKMKISKRQLKQIIKEEKSKILKEMAKGPSDGYGGYEYREDKSQFDDARSALKDPLGVVGNDANVSHDLWEALMDIFKEAHAKGVSKESIAGIAQDAARDFDV